MPKTTYHDLAQNQSKSNFVPKITLTFGRKHEIMARKKSRISGMFVGREEELASLKELLAKQTASLVACRGRRRIGKSTLIKEFARRNRLDLIVIEGLGPRKGQTNADQLRNFGERLCAQTSGPRVVPDSWMEAFRLLAERIDRRRRTVVLLDEISWMGRHEKDFAGLLKNGWDDELKDRDNLILVVCGSVSSWIQRNLLDSATFGGRFSRSYVLRELPIDICLKFWRGREKWRTVREFVDVLSVTGGVPRYLEEIDPALSADENVRRMCFRAEGPLFKDFASIFSETFGKTALVKADILRSLCASPATCSELANRLGVERGGSLTQNLNELVEAGFLSKDAGISPETGRPSRLFTYRVSDNYTRFFLKYVEPHEEEILRGRYAFGLMSELPGWATICGLQFENLVVNHVDMLLPRLGLAGQTILSASPYSTRGCAGRSGVQIDLLIQTRRAAYIVEVKRRDRIGREIADELASKLAAFPHRRGISVFTVLVYEGEIESSVVREGIFDFVIPFRELLGRPDIP